MFCHGVVGIPRCSRRAAAEIAEPIRLHGEECLSFRNVITFNLGEYDPIEGSSGGTGRRCDRAAHSIVSE